MNKSNNKYKNKHLYVTGGPYVNEIAFNTAKAMQLQGAPGVAAGGVTSLEPFANAGAANLASPAASTTSSAASGLGAGMTNALMGIGFTALSEGAKALDNYVINKDKGEYDDLIYGSVNKDPLANFAGMMGSNRKQIRSNVLSQKKTFETPGSTTDFLENWENAPKFQGYNKIKGLGWKNALAFAMPFIDFRGDDVKFDLKRTAGSAKGASYGSMFGPWGALAGAALGDLAEWGSRFSYNKNIDAYNAAVDEVQDWYRSTGDLAATNMLTDKRDILERNFSAYGGPINKADINNGVTFFNVGGTHEENPNGGILQGIAPDGKPNMVEEGEVLYNDYVFSNRLNVPKAIRNKYKLKGKTFADVFAYAQKESEERPNDPISRRGLEHQAMILASVQESMKQRNSDKHIAAFGGHLFSSPNSTNNNSSTMQRITPFDLSKFVVSEGGESMIPMRIINNGKEEIKYFPKSAIEGKDTFTYNGRRVNIGPDSDYSVDVTSPANHTGLTMALRGASILPNVEAVISDTIGRTNKPVTYNNLTPPKAVNFRPIGDYIPITKTDTRYYLNQAEAQNAATLSALRQANNPSVGANILAQNYLSTIAQGDIYNKAIEANLVNEMRAREFNRASNQFNTTGLMEASKADIANLLAYQNAKDAELKSTEDSSNVAFGARAKNIQNLGAAVAGIGQEIDARDWRNALINSDVYGTMNDYMNSIRANGGKLNKKKKGLTF